MKQYPQSFVANVDNSEKPGTHWVAFYFIDDQHGEFLTPMDYLLIDTQNILKISKIEMQLNGLTIGSISRVYLQTFVDITVYFTFTIVVIMLR